MQFNIAIASPAGVLEVMATMSSVHFGFGGVLDVTDKMSSDGTDWPRDSCSAPHSCVGNTFDPNVQFDPASHVYWDGDSPKLSTTLVCRIVTPAATAEMDAKYHKFRDMRLGTERHRGWRVFSETGQACQSLARDKVVCWYLARVQRAFLRLALPFFPL